MKTKNEIIKTLVTKRCGVIKPDSIEEFIGAGGYQAVVKAFSMQPEQIIGEVKASNLKGRGGAGFPTGIKMDAVLKAEGSPKYIICNADEGEPGNFKDKYLMENDPHQLLEGMIICAYAVGASHGYIYIRGEYGDSMTALEKAIADAKANGWLGANIKGSGFSFDVMVHSGAGSYVCGEEFALIESLEGKPGRPTTSVPIAAIPISLQFFTASSTPTASTPLFIFLTMSSHPLSPPTRSQRQPESYSICKSSFVY